MFKKSRESETSYVKIRNYLKRKNIF